MVPEQEVAELSDDNVWLRQACATITKACEIKDAEIAALTVACENLRNALSATVSEEAKVIQERDILIEQRDRAMKVIEVARAYRGGTLDDALVAFDAEATIE